MTDNEMLVKIAEACPFVWKSSDGGYEMHWADTVIAFDPLSDLNAMHLAEQTLTEIQRNDYKNKPGYPENLASVLGIDYDPHDGILDYFEFTHASARQRAEAFLKTIA